MKQKKLIKFVVFSLGDLFKRCLWNNRQTVSDSDETLFSWLFLVFVVGRGERQSKRFVVEVLYMFVHLCLFCFSAIFVCFFMILLAFFSSSPILLYFLLLSLFIYVSMRHLLNIYFFFAFFWRLNTPHECINVYINLHTYKHIWERKFQWGGEGERRERERERITLSNFSLFLPFFLYFLHHNNQKCTRKGEREREREREREKIKSDNDATLTTTAWCVMMFWKFLRERKREKKRKRKREHFFQWRCFIVQFYIPFFPFFPLFLSLSLSFSLSLFTMFEKQKKITWRQKCR